MKTRAACFSLTIVAILIIGVILGCGGKAADACVATVDYQGQKFEGKASEEFEAKKNACNNYCRDADPEYDARYRIWLDSSMGRAAGRPSKQEAIFKDKDLMKFVTETCSRVCTSTMKPEAKCG